MQVQGQQARHFPLNYVSGTVLAIIALIAGLVAVGALSVTDNLPKVFEDDDATSISVPAAGVNRPADRGISREGFNPSVGAIIQDPKADFSVRPGEGLIDGSGSLAGSVAEPKAFHGIGMGEGLIDGSNSLRSQPAATPVDHATMRWLEDNLNLPAIRTEAPLDLQTRQFIDENTYLPGIHQDGTNEPTRRPSEGPTPH